MKMRVSFEVTVNELNGFSESDVASVFEGMGDFEGAVKRFVEEKLDGDVAVDGVAVTGVEVDSDE